MIRTLGGSFEWFVSLNNCGGNPQHKKGGNLMKKIFGLFAGAVLAFSLVGGAAHAATPDPEQVTAPHRCQSLATSTTKMDPKPTAWCTLALAARQMDARSSQQESHKPNR
jgi:hypothetical protein